MSITPLFYTAHLKRARRNLQRFVNIIYSYVCAGLQLDFRNHSLVKWVSGVSVQVAGIQLIGHSSQSKGLKPGCLRLGSWKAWRLKNL
jgi:hypothetical protein